MNMQNFVNVTLILTIDFIIILSIYLVVSFLRLRKQKKPFEELHSALKVGCSVILSNGFYGHIIDLKKDVAIIEIAPKVHVKVSRFAIQSIVEEK